MLQKSITKRKHTPKTLTSNFPTEVQGENLAEAAEGNNTQAIEEKKFQKISNTYKCHPL